MFTQWYTTGACISLFLLFTSPAAGTSISSVNYSENGLHDGPSLAKNRIVINELLYRRESAGKPEFIELFNMGEEAVQMGGWFLEDSDRSAMLPEHAVILPGSYLVLTDQQSFANLSERVVYLSSWPGFSNAGDAVVLRTPSGVAADSVWYEPDWTDPRPGPGVSLERIDPSALSHDPSNWALSRDPRGSSPGEINSVFKIDRLGPVPLFARLQQNHIEVIFSEFIFISQDTRFRLNGMVLPVPEYNATGANRVVLPYVPSANRNELIMRAENLKDYQGNVTVSAEHPVAQSPEPGDLLFNEIMYHELPVDTVNGLGQSEYLEIANSRNFTLSLEGVSLREGADKNGQSRQIHFTDTRHKYLLPNEYAVIFPETDAIPYHLSRTGRYYNASEEANRRSLRADRMTLSLTNTGKKLLLTDSTGIVLDYAHYLPDWHNPNIADTRGIALERISLDHQSDNGNNWTSSSAALGGTPAEENSVNRHQSETTGNSAAISLQPNPFSPDADGYDDLLGIRYEFDNPDYLLKVRVYDRYGRLIHKLADSYRAGYSGELFWDGNSSDGYPNRIGIYIVWIEAYHAGTGSREVLKEAAVLARRLD